MYEMKLNYDLFLCMRKKYLTLIVLRYVADVAAPRNGLERPGEACRSHCSVGNYEEVTSPCLTWPL